MTPFSFFEVIKPSKIITQARIRESFNAEIVANCTAADSNEPPESGQPGRHVPAANRDNAVNRTV